MEFRFEVLNDKQFREAAKRAPKLVVASVRREMKRVGDKFGTGARRALLNGPPGIYLPARVEVQSLKTRKSKFVNLKARDKRSAQQANIKTKVSRPKDRGVNSFLVGYGSRFLEYHERKIKSAFDGLFRLAAATLGPRVQKEAQRITQQVLDKGLRDRIRR